MSYVHIVRVDPDLSFRTPPPGPSLTFLLKPKERRDFHLLGVLFVGFSHLYYVTFLSWDRHLHVFFMRHVILCASSRNGSAFYTVNSRAVTRSVPRWGAIQAP